MQNSKTKSLSEEEAKRVLGFDMIAAARLLRETQARQSGHFTSLPEWLKPQASPFSTGNEARK